MNKLNIIRTIKNYIFPTVFGVLLFSSCNIIKTIHLLKQGHITPAHFKEEIPFEFRAGIMVIKILIDGKYYDFIFDTGATNAVSLELAEKLNLKQISRQESLDFEGKSETIGFSTLQKLTIGQIDFNNTACAIVDLEKVPEIKCLKVEGLIGGNLLRKATWQIDYKNLKIIFADNIDSLHIPTNTPFVSFSPLITGTPVFKGKINGIETSKNIFDTGSSGDILLVKTDLDKLKEKDKTLKQIRGIGSKSSGLHGRKLDTTYLAKISAIKVGTMEITNPIVEFKKTDGGNFGSGFLKDYLVTFDWQTNKAWFQKYSEEKKEDWTSFGFVPLVKDSKMLIGYMYDNSPAQLSGLHLNDQIVSVNSIDYGSITDDSYCDMIMNKFSWVNTDTLNIVVRTTNGEKKVILIKKNIFEN